MAGSAEAAVQGKEVANRRFMLGTTTAEIVTLNFHPIPRTVKPPLGINENIPGAWAGPGAELKWF